MWDSHDYLSTGFGQASSITVLQLCQAYTSIFNDGTMMRPYVIDSIVDSDTKQTVKKYKKKAVGTPISSQSAKEVQELMSHVTDEGASGHRFKMDDIDLLMKTGTAQIYNENLGKYDPDYILQVSWQQLLQMIQRSWCIMAWFPQILLRIRQSHLKRSCVIRCRHMVFRQHLQLKHKIRMRSGRVIRCQV